MRLSCATLCLATALAAQPASAEPPAITPDGVFGVSIAMTLGQAKAALPGAEWLWEQRFMVDLSALCAERDGAELFCALVYEAETEDDALELVGLVVRNPTLTTAEGVRVGMPIVEVAALWGAPSFGFSVENESREYVHFADGPKGYWLRAALPGSDAYHIGEYPPDAGPTVFTTTRYPPEAVIGSIWLF